MPAKEMTLDDLKTFDLDGMKLSHDELKARFEDVSKMTHTMKEEFDKMEDGFISKTEYNDRIKKIAADVDKVVKEVERSRNADAAIGERFVYNDYRSMLESYDWLTKENGDKYAEVDYRAHALFQMPIEYAKHEHGLALRNLRDLHDAVIMVDAVNTHRNGGGGRYRLGDSLLFKQLIAQTKKFDEPLAHAMAGGNTGYGAEWLPTDFSSQFNEILRIQPSLSNKFQTWNMARGASGIFPFQNGKAKVYKGSESLVDAADQARKTNIATSNKTFTPVPFIGALVTSEELIEDAIIAMVNFIRTELATAILEGLDSALINGDTTATHMDNAAETYYQTYDVETAFKGIRRAGVDLSTTVDIEALSASTGVGALEFANLTELKLLMGTAGIKPDDCFYVTGPKGRWSIQNALFKEDASGILQYMVSGMLPKIDGSDVVISGVYLEDQESDGFGDNVGAEKHTSICCVHPKSYRIGQRRGVTLEVGKDILTQQQQFVATARYDFGNVAASAILPVAVGINVQHTA